MEFDPVADTILTEERIPRRASVHAFRLLQTRNLILHEQFAAFKFSKRQIVGRWMKERFSDLLL